MTTLFVLLGGWTLIGLVTGAIACPRHPGPDSIGWMGTLIVAIAGSLLGGGAAYSPTQAAGWIASMIWAIAFVSIPAFTGRAQRGT
jgi:uncharacterized membrane protein YeaQ/YmgE (transglycosylase-associated protein family)